jgi:hypothetical protein
MKIPGNFSTGIHLKFINLLFCAFFLFAFSGCNSVSKEWDKALTINTIESYTSFIEKYPKSQQVASARQLIKEIEQKHKQIEQKKRFENILSNHDINALKAFLFDTANEGILQRFKVGIGSSITLTSQPEKAKKGYRLSLKASKESGKVDYLLTIPPNTDVNVDFKENIPVKIIKGDLLVSVRNGSSSGYVTKNSEVTLLIKVNDNRAITLSSENVEIDSNMFVYLNNSEFIVTSKENVLMKRELSKNIFTLAKGEMYHIQFD